METKIIKESWIEGDLIFDGKLVFENDCYVTGKIKAKIIEAGESIKAGESIEAGESIKAGWSIKAGESIEAGESIKAGWSIKAGESIEAGGSIFSFVFEIKAKKIITRLLPLWRNYWADMPPLAKYRDEILDEDNCWADLKKLIKTKKEKEEICAWDGWHWILRAQLEMFFGLKKEYVIEE